jgi:outer membrane lipoprotein carrier protein
MDKQKNSDVWSLNLSVQKIRKRITLYILCMCSVGLSTAAIADDANALAKKLALLETFSGTFEQTLTDDKGEVLQASSGDFLLQRPGYFRWNTTEPFPQLLVSDLESIWMYDPDLEQVTVREYNDKLSATPALLLSGDVSKIKTHYQVKQVVDQRYVLTPLQQQELFTHLSVSFVDDQLSEMHLVDALGQTTVFRFVGGIYNQTIDRALFEFIPPAGTDVIVGN